MAEPAVEGSWDYDAVGTLSVDDLRRAIDAIDPPRVDKAPCGCAISYRGFTPQEQKWCPIHVPDWHRRMRNLPEWQREYQQRAEYKAKERNYTRWKLNGSKR